MGRLPRSEPRRGDASPFSPGCPVRHVVLTGGDLGDFLDLARRVRGLGRAVKSAVRDWLRGNVTPYAAQKYRCALADAIRLCHFRAVRLLRNLDGLSNWEGRYTPAIWRAAARRMPVGRFLRTMDKLRREGALEPETVIRKVTAANLRATKVLPFRVYAAWKALWADVPANRSTVREIEAFLRSGRERSRKMQLPLTIRSAADILSPQ